MPPTRSHHNGTVAAVSATLSSTGAMGLPTELTTGAFGEVNATSVSAEIEKFLPKLPEATKVALVL